MQNGLKQPCIVQRRWETPSPIFYPRAVCLEYEQNAIFCRFPLLLLQRATKKGITHTRREWIYWKNFRTVCIYIYILYILYILLYIYTGASSIRQTAFKGLTTHVSLVVLHSCLGAGTPVCLSICPSIGMLVTADVFSRFLLSSIRMPAMLSSAEIPKVGVPKAEGKEACLQSRNCSTPPRTPPKKRRRSWKAGSLLRLLLTRRYAAEDKIILYELRTDEAQDN